MILGLEYMHSKNIIYRDLKPENIMVDKNGIMYIIDLGTAKILDEKKHNGRTLTMIGTPHYMAPEVFIGGKGYTKLVDLWSLGVCLYEFVVGNLPFGDAEEDPYLIYNSIANTNIEFPKFVSDKNLRKIIL